MAKNPHDPSMEKVPVGLKVILGSVSGMIATTFVHPLDLLKVRLQIYNKPETSKQMAQKVIKCDGHLALFRGLSAGLLRQSTYTSTRLAVYYFLYDEYIKRYKIGPTLNDKVMLGVWSGMVGAFIGNPSEVALVRLMSDGPNGPCCPSGNKRRYRGVFDVFIKIIRNEGVRSLWRGGLLTMLRSIFVSVAQIETYATTREILRGKKLSRDLELHFYTSVMSSFLTALASLPVDVVKTLYQVRNDDMRQRDIIYCLVRSRGITCFWKGFFPYFTRLAFHTFVTFYVLDQFCNLYRYLHHHNGTHK